MFKAALFRVTLPAGLVASSSPGTKNEVESNFTPVASGSDATLLPSVPSALGNCGDRDLMHSTL